MADGVKCLRFGREMDGDNPRLPAFPGRVLFGFQPVSETPLAGIRLPDAIVQASAIHLYVGDGEQWKHRVLLSAHTISVPVSEKLPYLRDLFTSAAPPFQGRHPTHQSLPIRT